MRFGVCGHPLRGGECEEGTPIECDYCTVCFLLEMDSQTVRWDDEEHNDSDLDGESISCILHAEAWNEYHGGREDEANAWGGLVGGGSMYTIEEMRAFEEQGRPRSVLSPFDVTDRRRVAGAFEEARFLLANANRNNGGLAIGITDADAADQRIGHTSRNVPAWNEEQPMTESRTMWMMRRAGADVGAGLASMLMTPEQAEAWDDNDGRILFDTVNTRGAVDARWINEPGATPRQPND